MSPRGDTRGVPRESPSASDDPHGRAERLRRIEAVTDATLSYLDVEDLLSELLDRVLELLEVDVASVLLLDPSDQKLVPTAARGLEESIRQGVRVPLGGGFAGRIASDRRPAALADVRPADVVNPLLLRKGVRSMLGVPMLVGGEIIGVIEVGTLTPRRFTEEDTALLQIVADRASAATQFRRNGTDRAAARALQRSLLPARLPVVAGVEMAARYVPGHDIGVGGDWYDVFPLPGDRLGVVVGDVTGHGLRAAVVMGRLRSALRAYALECDDPAEVLTRLDRKVQHFETGMMATVLYAIVPPERDQAIVSLAGHPPPIQAGPGHPARLVALDVDLPIGADEGTLRRSSRLDLSPGRVLVLYTDGLVERHGESIDAGLRRLTDCVRAEPAEQVCATVMANLVGEDEPIDDIALLVLYRPAAQPRPPNRR